MVFVPVIGLEIHVQLHTRSKIFATESYRFGGSPNSHVGPLSMAHPGALPSINEACVHHAVALGLAVHAEIDRHCRFARKNYFYPDLPKGYQLSQDRQPICRGGYIAFPLADGTPQRIGLERIHLEEDAGKSIHDQDPAYSFIDLNRAGTGLVEIVTMPELHSAEAAGALLAEVRRIVRYLGISEANMEEGNLRCDANVSIMPEGATQLGTRVEVKNINSISFLIRAISYEIQRQTQIVGGGGRIVRETRTWDPVSQQTLPMRDKETADDYRYFPEPDLLPLAIPASLVADLHARQPRLPYERFVDYTQTVGVPINEALALVEDRAFSDYYEALRAAGADPRMAANWMLGSVRTFLNEQGCTIDDMSIDPARLAKLIALVQEEKISHHAAKEQVFPAMLAQPAADPPDLARALGVELYSQADALQQAMADLLRQYPDEAARYRNGKKQLAGFFVGQLMRAFQGKAHPQEVQQVVRTMLET
ncbi:MAG: Asp-tRNA(Asn)/Glu-tRNA(Gln) amidotransferase subunit GatB [Bacteroidia bacterium]